MTLVQPESFWARVDVYGAGECWPWLGYRNSKGYGRLKDPIRRPVSAHRVAFELVNGPVPDGLTLDHLCRNRGCVNPAHLEPVTNRTNVLRGEGPSAANARRTECVNGHPFDQLNTYRDPRGRRQCRACSRLSQQRVKQRRRSQDSQTKGVTK